MIKDEKAFIKDLAALINKHSRENISNTPDFLLAEFLYSCLAVAEALIRRREKFYGHSSKPGQP